MKHILPFFFALLMSNVCFAQTYVNGSVLTGTTTYSGVTNPTVGYQWSETAYDAPNTTYASTNAGFSCNRTAANTGFRMADDFVIPAGEKWTINTLEFLAYQTGYAGVTSPFNEMYVEIWNGAPNVVGSTIVFGDMVTNRFSSSSEIFAHRIFNTVAPPPGTASGTTRRIWKTIANANVTLCAGTYWVVFQTGINNASVYSGHFAPPVTLPNVRAVPGANALQYNESTSTWIQSIDAGNPATANDEFIAIPFTVNYTDANPLTITASPNAAVCVGSNITLTAGGATVPYTWSGGISDGVPFQLNANNTYTVSSVDGSGCNVSKSIDVTTIALPAVTASSIPVPATVCDGGSVTLLGSGATTYTWSGPVPISDNTPFIANASAAGTYTVTGSDGTCSSTATIQLTVNPLPTVTATSVPSPAIVCQGGSVTLNGGGATSYTWSDGVNTQTDGVAFFPATSSTYTVTGTDAGCSSTATIAVTVNSFQTPPAAPTPEILFYKFDGSGTTVPNLALTPPAGTANATIMGGLTQGGTGLFGGALNGTGIASTTDYLNTGWAPNLGAGSWSIAFWSSGISTNTTLYYIFGDLNSNGFRCFTNGVAGSTNWILRGAGLTDITIPGGALMTPTMNAFVYDATLNNVKAYMNGVLVSTVAQTAPTLTGTGPLKVMGYSSNVGAPVGGMLDEFRVYNRALTPAEIATLPLPQVVFEATANPAAICAGASSTLTATGASSYTWQPGGMTGSSVNVTPSATTTYTITGTDAGGCTANTTVTVTINTPTVVANATPNSAVCDGTSITLFGSGATSYTWAGPIAITDNTPFTANVVSAGTYTVTGTDAGCSSTATIAITVNPISAAALVMPSSTVKCQTLLQSGANTYSNPSCELIANLNATGLGSTDVCASFVSNQNWNGEPYGDRIYSITPATNGSGNVCLYYTAADLLSAGITNNSEISITKVGDNGVLGGPGSVVEILNSSMTITDIGSVKEVCFPVSSFSSFYLHSINPNNIPLSVDLTDFVGHIVGAHDELSWTTNNERNFDYFNVQHSTDGIHFTTLDKIYSKAANGNSNQTLNYAYKNFQPKAGHNYYRLQQVDKEGKLSLSTKIVDLIHNSSNEVSIYPNPVKDILHIELFASQSQKNTIKLIDMSGRLVKQVQVSSTSGINNFEMNLAEVASGLYTLEVYANDHMMHVSRIRKSN